MSDAPVPPPSDADPADPVGPRDPAAEPHDVSGGDASSMAYQAAARVSPWGYVFLLGLAGFLSGWAWYRVEDDTGITTQVWIFLSALLTLAPDFGGAGAIVTRDHFLDRIEDLLDRGFTSLAHRPIPQAVPPRDRITFRLLNRPAPWCQRFASPSRGVPGCRPSPRYFRARSDS